MCQYMCMYILFWMCLSFADNQNNLKGKKNYSCPGPTSELLNLNLWDQGPRSNEEYIIHLYRQALKTSCEVQQGLGNHWPNLLLCDLKQYCMYTVFGFILQQVQNQFHLPLIYSPISCRQIPLLSVSLTSFRECCIVAY